MQSAQSSVTTVQGSTARYQSTVTSKLDLTGLPPIFILPTHLTEAELHIVEDTLISGGALLTYEIKEANLILGNISKERRAKFELKSRNIGNGEQKHSRAPSTVESKDDVGARKRPKFSIGDQSSVVKSAKSDVEDGSTTTDITDDETTAKPLSQLPVQNVSPSPNVDSCADAEETPALALELESFASRIKVVKLSWLHDSISTGIVQPLGRYTIYESCLISPDEEVSSPEQVPQKHAVSSSPLGKSVDQKKELAQEIMQRAKADANKVVKPKFSRTRRRDQVKEAADQDFQGQSFVSSKRTASKGFKRTVSQPPQLLRQTTSEYDEEFSSSNPMILPDWAKENRIFSCERATPLNPPNADFIAQLKIIRTARLLIGDEVGVRAYSTSIASIAAYPYLISSTREILALPGCEQKIATLFHEWHTTGHIQASSDIEANPKLKVLHAFYDIWGVGASTAREFYYDRHWRDLDDVIEHGWKSLTRVQQ